MSNVIIHNLKKLLAIMAGVFFLLWVTSSPALAKSHDSKRHFPKLKNHSIFKHKYEHKSAPTLIAHWAFDEGRGPVTKDSTPIPQNGWLNNVLWETTQNNCPLGACLSFNGTNSFVNISGKSHFKADALSITAWVYSEDFCKYNNCQSIIVEKSRLYKKDDDDYFSLELVKIENNVYPRFHLRIKGKTVTVTGDQNMNGALHDDLWAHIAAIYDGKTLSLYKNSIKIGSVNASGPMTNHGAGTLRIGAGADSPVRNVFFGKIDDVRIYRDDLPLDMLEEIVDQTSLDLYCGDKIANNDEECDGNSIISCSENSYQGTKECTDECTLSSCELLEYCGDNTIQSAANESCDDGNTASGDGCTDKCVKEFCGDGVIQPALGEQCDDANQVATDGCSLTCKVGYCGDGIIQADLNETCDQNTVACEMSTGYEGTRSCQPGCATFNVCQTNLFCGDNICSRSVENTTNCRTDCPVICGDNIVDGTELCDDGNTNNNDGCDIFCQQEFCGDGVLQSAMGEECDDKNTNETDLCTNHCTQNICTVNPQSFVPVKVSTSPVCNGSYVSSPEGVIAWTAKISATQCDIMLKTATNFVRVTATTVNEKLLSVNNYGGVAWDNDHPLLGKKVYYYYNDYTFEIENNLFGSDYPLSSGRYDNTFVQLSTNRYGVWLSRNPHVDGFPFDVVKYNFEDSKMERITDNNYPDENVKIDSFGIYTWQANVNNEDAEIFYNDGKLTRQLTDNQWQDTNPVINDNGWVAWQGFDGNDTEIYLFNKQTILQITDNDYDDFLPQINKNNQLVWTAAVNNKSPVDNANHEIFAYDQGFIMQLTNNLTEDKQPQINQNGIIAWVGHPLTNTPENQEIYLHVQGHTYQLTNDTINDRDVTLTNNSIIWIKGNNVAALDLIQSTLPVNCTTN